MCKSKRIRPVFSSDTQQLLKYIGRNKMTPFHFSKTSQTVLRTICYRIHQSIVHSPEYQMTNIEEMNDFHSSLKHDNDINHIPEPMLNDILHADKIGRKVTAIIHGRNIELFLILPTNNAKYSRILKSQRAADTFFHNCAFRIVSWLDIVLSVSHCVNDLKIFIFLTKFQKHLPNKTSASVDIDSIPHTPSHIDRKHANTAYTWSCISSSKIVIFRSEEWFKVLIHESFHCFGLDFSQMNSDESNKQMHKFFPKCSPTMDFSIYETYCEIWAELFNVLFIAYHSVTNRRNHTRKHSHANLLSRKQRSKISCTRTRNNIHGVLPKTQIKNIISIAEQMITREIMFSLLQMTKIIHHYNLTYDELCISRKTTNGSSQKYTEKTPVFAYYIIKTILLFYLNHFIEWCNTHNSIHSQSMPNNKPLSILNFNKDNVSVNSYGELINQCRTSPEFLKIVSTEKQKYINQSLQSPIASSTLRMSLYEMETT